jgi:hypothetical protein
MLYFRAILLLIAFLGTGWAEEKWIRLKTANFEVYTPQSEKKARETALYFEQLREFFLGYWGTQAEPGTPVRIVLFGNEKQYQPFRPHEKAAGYFTRGIDRDWIVLSGYLPGWERLVCHEYTHLMVRQAGLPVPVWLNEGLAEIYSTFKPAGAKVQVGDLIPGHFYAVQTGWIPLARLFEVKHDSPEYNGKNTAQFYAEAWGLTHMLMLEQEYRKVYAPMLSKLIRGADWKEALAGAQLDAKQLDLDLQNYMKRNDRFFASLIPFKSTRSDADWSSERIAGSEVDAMLGLLQLNQGKATEAARVRIGKLEQGSWHSEEALAYLAWREGNLKLANEHFAKAIQLGATSAKLYYDAARAAMYAGDRGGASVAHLEKAVALYPTWVDAKLQLVEQYLYVGAHQKALEVGGAFKKIGPGQASRLFRALAYAEAMLTGVEYARKSAQRAQEFAKTDFDKVECERLSGFLGRAEEAARRKESSELVLAQQMKAMRERADANETVGFGEIAGDSASEARPVIRRADAAELTQAGGTEMVMRVMDSIAFTGILVHVQCEGSPPLLRFEQEDGHALELEIGDVSRVNREVMQPGEVLKPLELSCGDQRKKVKASYGKPTGDQTKGQLRTIQYID